MANLVAIKRQRTYCGPYAEDIAGNINCNSPLLASMPNLIGPSSIRSLTAVSRDASDKVSAETKGAEGARRIPSRWCLLTSARVRKFHLKK